MPDRDEKEDLKPQRIEVVGFLAYVPQATLDELNLAWREAGFVSRAECVRKVLTEWLRKARKKQNAS